MSNVTYKVGEESFTFSSHLNIITDEELFQFTEHLMEEIKNHKHHLNPQPRTGYIHDVEFVDNNGMTVSIRDFIDIGNLNVKIIK